MNKHTALKNAIMLALSQAGCTVWNNETSRAWVGKVIHRDKDQVTLAGAQLVAFGLCDGSADIAGMTPDGQFLAVEVKTPDDRLRKKQAHFIDAVNEAGGLAFVARSVEGALEGIGHG